MPSWVAVSQPPVRVKASCLTVLKKRIYIIYEKTNRDLDFLNVTLPTVFPTQPTVQFNFGVSFVTCALGDDSTGECTEVREVFSAPAGGGLQVQQCCWVSGGVERTSPRWY